MCLSRYLLQYICSMQSVILSLFRLYLLLKNGILWDYLASLGFCVSMQLVLKSLFRPKNELYERYVQRSVVWQMNSKHPYVNVLWILNSLDFPLNIKCIILFSMSNYKIIRIFHFWDPFFGKCTRTLYISKEHIGILKKTQENLKILKNC